MGEWLWILLLALGGFLIGGVISVWKTAKFFAIILLLLALLAIAGGVVWYLST
ncbi:MULTISPECIES: hypothetical protein [Sciscionella]|uniref:hypothetical protein n=1 Tax=Sciscionella TaxID=596495 RepID=UPI00037CFEC9|nr:MULTISPECIES: hypothetical protein [Sciscionella]